MESEQKRKRAEWVKALRSGEFSQTKGQLRLDGSFCCLGVLCNLSDPNSWSSYDAKEAWLGSSYMPPAAVLREFGISSGAEFRITRAWIDEGCPSHLRDRLEDTGNFDETNLAALNDDHDFTFEEIADVIEAEPPGLIVTGDE